MRYLAVALAAFVLAGCGDSNGPTTRHLRLGGQRVALVEPAHGNGHVVLFMHGAGQAYDALLTDPGHEPLEAALLGAGYAIAAGEADGDNWGNAAGVGDYSRLIAWLHGQGYRVDVLAESMGALPAFTLLDDALVQATAVLYPVCDPATIRGASASIASAWPAGPPAGPVEIPMTAGARLLVLASPDDAVAPKALNADACAAAARRQGAAVTEVTTSGDHGDPSNFAPGRLLQFFAA